MSGKEFFPLANLIRSKGPGFIDDFTLDLFNGWPLKDALKRAQVSGFTMRKFLTEVLHISPRQHGGSRRPDEPDPRATEILNQWRRLKNDILQRCGNTRPTYRIPGRRTRLSKRGTYATVDEIRCIRMSTTTVTELASRYNLSPSTVYAIKSRRAWSNVE